MNPVPAVEFFNIPRQAVISASSWLVIARIMRPSGHTLSFPVWTLPTPSAAVPRKNHGSSGLSAYRRVFSATGSPSRAGLKYGMES